jgi:N-acetyl sugar amidotransferase
MDTTIPHTFFDENGICNHCKDYERVLYGKRASKNVAQELDKIVDKIKKRGKRKDYDCILGVSGGVDSSYAAYQAKKLGLRPLAVHFDNGWNTELSVKNIENIVKKLGFPLYTYVVDWEEFKDLQLAFLKSSVPNIEIATDHGIAGSLYLVASKFKVNYIITGGNFVTEGILPSSFGHNNKDFRNLKDIHKRFGRVKLRTYPILSILRYFRYTLIKQIKKVRILDYIEYNRAEAKDILINKLDWKDYGGKHYESFFTKFFQAYILPTKFNLDKRRPHLSTLILSGQITRAEALKQLALPLYTKEQLDEDIAFFIKKLGLTQKEYGEIMSSAPKKHTDYATADRFFEIAKPISNFLRKSI